MTEFCPNCGHRKANTDPVKWGKWQLAPKHVLYDGRYLPLTPKESELLYELAKLGGRTVSAAILGGWLSATENPRDLAQVMVCNIRKQLRDVAPCPIETDFARGYRWKEAA